MMIERANSGLHDFIFKVIVNRNLIKKETTVLDIGSGSGAWLKRFKDLGINILFGVDLEVKQFSLEGTNVLAMNIDNYNDEKLGAFDLITSLELIEHLEYPGNLFKMIDNNLSVNGAWVISTPNIHSINARLRFLIKGRLGHFDNKSVPTHIYPVYTENLERILKRYNLRISEIISFPASGTLNYSFFISCLAKIISLFVPRSTPGDNIIYIINRD